MTALTSKGQATVPKEVRDFLGVQAGDQIEYVIVGDHVELRAKRRATPYELGKHLFGKWGSGKSDSSTRAVRKQASIDHYAEKDARRRSRR
jgi:AbrB family looped-hinge helix DNA binding protein